MGKTHNIVPNLYNVLYTLSESVPQYVDIIDHHSCTNYAFSYKSNLSDV